MVKIKTKFKVHKHLLLIILAILLIAFLVFQFIFDWNTYRVNEFRIDSQAVISQFVDNAVEQINSPAPVDAQTGEVYFPYDKLRLPQAGLNSDPGQIEYSGSIGPDFGSQVTSRQIVAEAENKLLLAQTTAQSLHKNTAQVFRAIFGQVPNLQACVRGVRLSYKPQDTKDTGLKLSFTKVLANGKRIYEYNETACKSFDYPDLVNYLKQIQSY